MTRGSCASCPWSFAACQSLTTLGFCFPSCGFVNYQRLARRRLDLLDWEDSFQLLEYFCGYLSEMTRSKGVSPLWSKAVNDVSLNINGELFSGFEKLEGFKPRT